MMTISIERNGKMSLRQKRHGNNEYGTKRPACATEDTPGGERLTARRNDLFDILLFTLISTAVLDQVKDGWEFVIDPDVRCLHSKIRLSN